MPRARKKAHRIYKPHFGVQVGDKDIRGVKQGFHCFHVVKTGRVWVHLVQTSNQKYRKCSVELWQVLLARGVDLAERAKRLAREEAEAFAKATAEAAIAGAEAAESENEEEPV